MEFAQYLEMQLAKPTHEYYDPNGNSARAIVVRGFWREVMWQYREYPKRLRYLIGEFDGLETPLGWFLGVPFMLVFAPIFPVTAAIHWHRKSIAEYRSEYAMKYDT